MISSPWRPGIALATLIFFTRFCHWKTLQGQVLPLENPPAPNSATGKPFNAGFWLWKNLSGCFRSGGRGLGAEVLAFVPPENPPTPNSATGKPLNAGFWLGKNLSDCFRSGGRGRGLGGRGLGHPCESPLGNLATVRVAHPGLVLGCQIWVPKKDPFFGCCP